MQMTVPLLLPSGGQADVHFSRPETGNPKTVKMTIQQDRLGARQP